MTHDDHREGLAHDLPRMQEVGMVRRPMARRGLLGLLGGAGTALLVGCGTSSTGSSGTASSSGGTTQDAVSVADGEVPEETGGPYPADGSNGVNVLTESGIVRSDIRSSFGDANGVADGVPLTIALKVYDLEGEESTPYAGAAVYLWHCDRDGEYSLYSSGLEEENYLRGVQEVAEDGTLTFTSIVPACYIGRWPHLHFEVYGSLDDATSATNKLRTSQIALPEDVCTTVYAQADGYEASRSNLTKVSLDTDNVFGDGHSLQMAALTGSVEDGYTLRLNVPV